MDLWLVSIEGLVGGVGGFILAQFANLAKILWSHYRRPVLLISSNENCIIEKTEGRSSYDEFFDIYTFGFSVTNTGKTVAKQVRAELTAIEWSPDASEEFRSLISGGSLHLNPFHTGSIKPIYADVFPDRQLTFQIARFHDHPGEHVYPLVDANIPSFAEAIDGERFRYSIVVYDESRGASVHAKLTLSTGKPKRVDQVTARETEAPCSAKE